MNLFMTIMEIMNMKNMAPLFIILTKSKNKKMTNDSLLQLFNLGSVLFCLAIRRSKLRRTISICQQFIIPIIRNISISWLFRKDQSIHNQDLFIKKSLLWFYWLLNTSGLVHINKTSNRLSWKNSYGLVSKFSAKSSQCLCIKLSFSVLWDFKNREMRNGCKSHQTKFYMHGSSHDKSLFMTFCTKISTPPRCLIW